VYQHINACAWSMRVPGQRRTIDPGPQSPAAQHFALATQGLLTTLLLLPVLLLLSQPTSYMFHVSTGATGVEWVIGGLGG
jgi:hypothetical protein